MRLSSVRIESVGTAIGDEVWTSTEIEQQLAPVYEKLNLSEGRLELMTGVRERRFFPRGTRPSEIARQAGAAALAGVSEEIRARIGALLHSSVCRDFAEPATASVVHAGLGLPERAMIFDLSNACLGFVNAITVVGAMIEARQIDAALIVSGEDGRELVESTIRVMRDDPERATRRQLKRYFPSLTIGSAGVAMLLVHESLASDPARGRVEAGAVRTASQHHELCQGSHAGDGTTLMETDAEALLLAGVELAAETWADLRAEMGWSTDYQPPKLIGHQVGRAHRRAVFERLGFRTAVATAASLNPAAASAAPEGSSAPVEPDEPGSVAEFSTFEWLGNVGSAAAPITLIRAAEEGFLEAEDPVLLLGIGSGVTCQMLALTW